MRFPMRWKSAAMAGVLLLGHGLARAQGTLADYQRGQALAEKSRGGGVDVPGAANWIGETDHFWYTRSVRGGTEFVLVDAGAATKRPAFDHEKLAAAISAAGGKPCTGLTLPLAPQADTLAGFADRLDGAEIERALIDERLHKLEESGAGFGLSGGDAGACFPFFFCGPVASTRSRLRPRAATTL